MQLHRDVPLAPRTTLGLGGTAEYFVEADSDTTILEALAFANQQRLAVQVLGGGSNVVVADGGVKGLVIAVATRGITIEPTADGARVTAQAGESWDHLVQTVTNQGLVGLECLSGIPGSVGATPIQNVGAYGQDVSQTITTVCLIDRRELTHQKLAAHDCGFGYRTSRFKQDLAGRYVVTAVVFALSTKAPAHLNYPELAHALGHLLPSPVSANQVRDTVLGLRRKKSMLFEPTDPWSRGCGSFFLNPVVDSELAERIAASVTNVRLPQFPVSQGKVKLPAAWLIEQAGMPRGYREHTVGLSIHHALALVAHEGASAASVVGFARRISDRVQERFGITLVPEPHFWGFSVNRAGWPEVLD